MSPVNQWDRKAMARRSLATTAATAATIAAVGLCVVEESANAAQSAPHAMSRQEANGLVYTRAEAREKVNPGAVDYYVKEYGVSRQEAIERLATQGVAPNLQAPLEKSLGQDFAGLWFDNESGDWVVQVADKEASSAARGVMDRLGLGDYSRLDWVDYTQQDAEDAQRALGKALKQDLGEYTELGQLGLGAEALDLRLPNTLGREARSRVDAVIEKVGNQQAGPPVKVRYVDPSLLKIGETYGCSFPDCAVVTGGVYIYNEQSDGSWNHCTAGFKGGPAPSEISNSAFNWYTAGHCVQGGTPSANGDYEHSQGSWVFCSLNANGGCTPTTAGASAARYIGSNTGDAALLSANGSGTGQPNFTRWKGNQTNYSPVRGWYSQRVANGTTACYSGSTSGTGCGTVTSNNYTMGGWPSGNFKGMMKIEGGTFCPVPGDSGGPVVGPTDFAMGLVARSNHAPGCTPGGVAIAEPMDRAVDILGSEPIVTP